MSSSPKTACDDKKKKKKVPSSPQQLAFPGKTLTAQSLMQGLAMNGQV